MSVRITAYHGGNESTIRIEGRLDVDGVPDLRREVEVAGGTIRLDLSGLTSADAGGVKALLELSESGARLRGATAYIRQLLDMVSP